MTADAAASTQPAKLTSKQIVVNGVIAILVAIIANIVARLVLGALVTVPSDFPPMQIPPIVFFTVLYGIGAVLVYWLIVRFASNPQRVWLIVVIIAFVVTALPDLLLAVNPAAAPFPGGSAALYLLLLVYHVLAGLAYYFLIPRRR